MSAVAFQGGEKFKFPDDPTIYEFSGMIFDDGDIVIYYWHGDIVKERKGYLLSDLIKVK